MELNSISFPLKPGDPEYKETCASRVQGNVYCGSYYSNSGEMGFAGRLLGFLI